MAYDVEKPQLIKQTEKNGNYSYSSTNLNFNDVIIKGDLMKRITKVKFYHTSNFHKRRYEINFKKGLLLIGKDTDLKLSKEINL